MTLYKAVFVDDNGKVTDSPCYSTEKQAVDYIMRKCPNKDMIDEVRYMTYYSNLVIIVLREVFDDAEI